MLSEKKGSLKSTSEEWAGCYWVRPAELLRVPVWVLRACPVHISIFILAESKELLINPCRGYIGSRCCIEELNLYYVSRNHNRNISIQDITPKFLLLALHNALSALTSRHMPFPNSNHEFEPFFTAIHRLPVQDLKIPKAVLGRSIYLLKYEGNKGGDKKHELYFKEGTKGSKRTMIDREQLWKRNRNKMVSYKDRVGENQRDRERKGEKEM